MSAEVQNLIRQFTKFWTSPDKAWEKGRFRDHQWVAEQPLDVARGGDEVVILLTEAPKLLDLVRIKFEKR